MVKLKKYGTFALVTAFAVLASIGLWWERQVLMVRPEGENRNEETIRILTFSSANNQSMIFEEFYAGLEEGRELYGANVSISVFQRISTASLSRDKYQRGIVNALKPDYLLLASEDAYLADAGIPFFAYDGEIEGEELIAYVGTDNYGVGRAAAQKARDLLPEEEINAAAIMLGDNTVFHERYEGFLQVAEEMEKFSVKEIYKIAGDYDEYMRYVENLTKSGINFLFCEDSIAASVAARVLEKSDVDGRIKVVGVDLNDYTLPWLEKGTIQAVIEQNYYQTGIDLMKYLAEIDSWSGERVIYTTVKVMTQEDVL